MNEHISETSGWAEKNKKNTIRLGFWTAAWTVTVALATFGPPFLWEYDKTLTILAIVVNLAIGVGMIIANKHHLEGLDELQQKIQLEAMALALGVTLIVGIAYSLLDITNVISTDAEISYLIILMGMTYLGTTIFKRKRYS